MELTGYCVRCKQKGAELTGTKIHKTKNGKYMAKGKHACGTTVCVIMSEANAKAAVNEGLELVQD